MSSYLMRLFWLEACFTNVSSASRTESVTLYLQHRLCHGRAQALQRAAVSYLSCNGTVLLLRLS